MNLNLNILNLNFTINETKMKIHFLTKKKKHLQSSTRQPNQNSCEAGSILDNVTNCDVSPGVYYIPLVLIMLSTMVLGIVLMLLWCLVREEDEDEGGNKRGNYYGD